MAKSDIGFALNYTNIHLIDITPDAANRTWAWIAAGISDITPTPNETVEQVAYYDGGGQSESEVTGGQMVYAYTGNRKYGDAAQDFVAGLDYTYGEGRKTNLRYIAPDGRVVEGKVTVANIVNTGGAANAKGTFSFELHNAGVPKVVPPTYAAAPDTLTLQPVTVAVGKTAEAVLAALPEGSSDVCVWGVDDMEIATVDGTGVVKGIKEGTTKLHCRSALAPTLSAEATITVTAAEPEPEPTELTFTKATGATGLGDVTFDELGTLEMSQAGTKVTYTGTLNKVDNWTEFSSIPADLTGYYVPMVLSGPEGSYMGKTTRSGTWKVNAIADCDQDSGGLVVAVQKDQKSFTFQAFASKEDAEGKVNGTTYTVDLNGVTYAE